MSLDDLKDEDEWLRTGWLDEDGGMRVQSWVESVGNEWTAMQVSDEDGREGKQVREGGRGEERGEKRNPGSLQARNGTVKNCEC